MRTFPTLTPFKAGRHALDPTGVRRLALSESPFGASPSAVAAAKAELSVIHFYPNSDNEPLRGEIAAHYGVPPEWVLVGNGADELILLSILASCESGDTGATTERSFQGYEASLEIAGCRTVLTPLDESGPDVPRLVEAAAGADITIVCNPHNPLGAHVTPDDVAKVHRATQRAGGVLVLDEAYAEFASPDVFTSGIDAILSSENLVVLRTFSKAYGLAGLRCGYAVGHPDIIDAMARVRTALPYNVNRVAIAAAAAALADQEHLRHVVRQTTLAREWIAEGLGARGIECLPTQTNFVLAHLGPASERVVRSLTDDFAVSVRDAAPLGFPGYARVGVCPPDEVDGVVETIAAARDRLTDTAGSR